MLWALDHKNAPAPGRKNRTRRWVCSEHWSPRTNVAGLSDRVLCQQGLSFKFIESTPDAVRFTDRQGVIKTIWLHRALGADLFGSVLALKFVFLALKL